LRPEKSAEPQGCHFLNERLLTALRPRTSRRSSPVGFPIPHPRVYSPNAATRRTTTIRRPRPSDRRPANGTGPWEEEPMPNDLESVTIRTVAWRLLPLVFLLYLLSLVDRVNVGFAALTMNKDLGLTPYTYSLGVAAFFFGYIPCEVPSNLILERIGARRWIGRIAITWGIAASAMALVSGENSFLFVRFSWASPRRACSRACCSTSPTGSPAPTEPE
jgi:hypothetical protein